MTNREKLEIIAAGQDAVYKAGLRGATLNPVADEIIKLQRKYINESTNLLDLSLGLQETDEYGEGLRVTKRTIELIPSSSGYLDLEYATDGTLRDFAPSLVLGKKYELVWKVKDFVSYAYLRLYGYEPEDESKTSLVFVATEEKLSGPVIAVSVDVYDHGDYVELMGARATFYDIELYEIPEDVVADGLDERMDIIKEEVPAVYQAALNKGIEQGKQAEREVWWDAFTINGTRTDFNSAFKGAWWDDVSYNPPYVLRPTNAYHMFMDSKISERKVEVDLSNCTNVTWMFRASTIQHIGVCDFRNVSGNILHPFSFCNYLHTIDEIIINENSVLDGAFAYSPSLKTLKFTGTLAQNGLDLKSCIGLDRASHESIMSALSTTTTGQTVTFSKAAVDKAFEVYEGANDGSYNSIEWLDLVATRSNWNIALA